MAFAILVVVMLGTFLANYFSKPLYRATIQLHIERESNAVTIEDLFGIAASDQEFLQTQYVLLKSRGLALRVVDDHKLHNDPELNAAGVAGKTPQEVERIKENLANMLRGGIEITPVRSTALVEISYVGTSPRLTQKIAEAWGDSYMRMNIAKKLDSVQQANQFLSEQISTVKSDLDLSRHQLQEYGESRGIVSVGEGTENVVMTKLSQLNTDLTSAQNLLYEREASHNSLQRTAPEAVASNDTLVLRLTDELSRMQRDYSEKRTQFLEGHPVMKQLADHIEKNAPSVTVDSRYRQPVREIFAAYEHGGQLRPVIFAIEKHKLHADKRFGLGEYAGKFEKHRDATRPVVRSRHGLALIRWIVLIRPGSSIPVRGDHYVVPAA